MRLQLLIQRHALPDVQILFSVGTGPQSLTSSSQATISALLHDVNDLIPLESNDGEWGLEDYVVEVAATADQKLHYECLHFQPLRSVLKKDDEVVIRPLTTDEQRSRRLGGRHQISGDGRHLVDGVSFGRRWLRTGNRPGTCIPPRKRRRIAVDEDQENSLQLSLAPHASTGSDIVLYRQHEEDSDDDNDDDIDYQEADSSNEQHDDLASRVSFARSAEGNESSLDSGQSSEAEDEGLDNEEIEQLLEEANVAVQAAEAELRSSFPVDQDQVRVSRKRKRGCKRLTENESHDTFEGFSTPSGQIDVPTAELSIHRSEITNDTDDALEAARRNVIRLLDDQDKVDIGVDSEGESDFSASSKDVSSSDTDSLIENAKAQASKMRQSNQAGDHSDDEDADSYAQSDSSNSSLSTDSMVQELKEKQERKRQLNLLEDSSEDDTDTDSYVEADTNSISTSSSADLSTATSESRAGSANSPDKFPGGQTLTIPGQSNVTPLTNLVAGDVPSTNSATKQAGSAPGQGLSRTQKRNERNKRKKRLQRLQDQGLLTDTATFDDLRQHEQYQAEESPDFLAVEAANETPAQIASQVGDAPRTIPEESQELGTSRQSIMADHVAPLEDSCTVTATNRGEINGASPDQRRSKLDLSASRRMLFNSLGFRNPKTPEMERELRQEISNSFSPSHGIPSKPSKIELSLVQESIVDDDMDSWKDHIVLSAVECELDDVILPPPPFPFEQGWNRMTKKKTSMGGQSHLLPRVLMNVSDKSRTSTPPTHEAPTLHSPSRELANNFAALPDLQEVDIQPSAMIAYKILEMSAATGYQPQISKYQTGTIQRISADGAVFLEILQNGRDETPHDAETGERVYGRFELLDEHSDEEIDDGLRETRFSEMIDPKLVRAASDGKPLGISKDNIPITEGRTDVMGVAESVGVSAKSDPLLSTNGPDISVRPVRSEEEGQRLSHPANATTEATEVLSNNHDPDRSSDLLDYNLTENQTNTSFEADKTRISIARVVSAPEVVAVSANASQIHEPPPAPSASESSHQDAQGDIRCSISLPADISQQLEIASNLMDPPSAVEETQYSFVSFPSESQIHSTAAEDQVVGYFQDGDTDVHSTSQDQTSINGMHGLTKKRTKNTKRSSLRTSPRFNRTSENSRMARDETPASNRRTSPTISVSSMSQSNAIPATNHEITKVMSNPKNDSADTIEVERTPSKASQTSVRASPRRTVPEANDKAKKAETVHTGGLGMKRFLTRRKV